jgi:small multidrug resistance family-3 protein
VHEGRGWALALLGGLALFPYGFAATFQTGPHFGRILAAYGGVFVGGSLAWASRSTASAPTATTLSAR